MLLALPGHPAGTQTRLHQTRVVSILTYLVSLVILERKFLPVQLKSSNHNLTISLFLITKIPHKATLPTQKWSQLLPNAPLWINKTPLIPSAGIAVSFLNSKFQFATCHSWSCSFPSQTNSLGSNLRGHKGAGSTPWTPESRQATTYQSQPLTRQQTMLLYN